MDLFQNLKNFLFSDKFPYRMVEELIEKLLGEHKEENDECLSKSFSWPPGATFIILIFPVGTANNLMLRAPNIL